MLKVLILGRPVRPFLEKGLAKTWKVATRPDTLPRARREFSQS